jgi:hypothetical protein
VLGTPQSFSGLFVLGTPQFVLGTPQFVLGTPQFVLGTPQSFFGRMKKSERLLAVSVIKA